MFTPPRKTGPRRNQPKFTGKVRFRIGDTVRVISGKDKDKIGQVTKVLPAEGKVVIEGVNIVVKHKRPRPQANAAAQAQESGRVELASPLNVAKVQLVDPADEAKTTRIGLRVNADGSKERIAKRSGGVIENG